MNDLLQLATDAAREAGAAVRGYYRDRTILKDKGEDNPLTEADLASDRILEARLRATNPDFGWLSEESVDDPSRLEKEFAWIVDPLDGTQEFSEGRADWGVHVALTLGGKCALAAVALPSDDDVLWGVSLPGKTRAGSTKGTALVRGDSSQRARPRIVVSRSHTPPWVEKFARALDAELVPCGSAGYKVARLLAGEADIYAHTIGLKEWDTCAPETVARALGWHVSKLRGEEHAYNQKNPKNHELLVCRPAWRDRLLAALKESGALEPQPERVKK